MVKRCAHFEIRIIANVGVANLFWMEDAEASSFHRMLNENMCSMQNLKRDSHFNNWEDESPIIQYITNTRNVMGKTQGSKKRNMVSA